MNEVKECYKELKKWVEVLQKFVGIKGVAAMVSPNYKGSESQKKDTKTLHSFADFMRRLLDELDNEASSTQLTEMRQKMADSLDNLINLIENNPNWGKVIERDLTLGKREKSINSMYLSQYLRKGEGMPLMPENQIRYIHSMLLVLKNDLTNEKIKETPELPPIDAAVRNAANSVVLLHELGILKHLKDTFPYLPAQRLGELCGVITGKKSDYFREAISNAIPEKTRAFTDAGSREVNSILTKFGIDTKKKRPKN